MAAKVLRLKKYLDDVENGDQEIEHLWAHYVAKYLRILLMWFDTEEWAMAPKLAKAMHVTMIVSLFFFWLFLMGRTLKDFEDVSVTLIAEAVARTLGGHLVFLSFLLLNYYRHDLTECIRALDVKFRSVPIDSERKRAWKKETTKKYVFELKLFLVLLTMGVLCGVPLLLTVIISGEHAFDTIKLYTESYSPGWWLELVYQMGINIISGIFFACKQYILIELFYYLSVLLQVQSEDILELCQDPDFDADTEQKKFCRIIREVEELLEIGEKLKNIVSFYLMNFLLVTFLIMAIAGFSTLIESKDGWLQAIFTNMIYPAYIMSVTFCWAKIGEYYTDSVESIDDSLYNCNWTVAPLKMKKMILIYKIRFTQPNTIMGGPFYICNIELFGDIIKRAYYLLTLLLDRIT